VISQRPLGAHHDPQRRADDRSGAIVVLDSAGLAEWLGNRVVLVTGAGGRSARACRQIARFRPARLVLFDILEAALYEIQTALATSSRSCRSPRWSATSSTRRLTRRCARAAEPVFHAAAYKPCR
jgi:FlaA1/EpsC-like NDP-sugar epimerase